MPLADMGTLGQKQLKKKTAFQKCVQMESGEMCSMWVYLFKVRKKKDHGDIHLQSQHRGRNHMFKPSLGYKVRLHPKELPNPQIFINIFKNMPICDTIQG